MGRKVFISVLGTGFYGECVYQRDGFASSATRFIQQATLEMLTQGGDWTAADQGYVLLTEQARDTNWHIPGGVRNNQRTEADEPYMGLERVIDDMHLPFEVSGVAIPMGKDEEEIWQIFDTVYGLLQEGDELYFDLTHGFRYLPMLVLVLGNYAKFLKHAKVCSITYGNFETRSKDSVAPIIDITAFSTLQDWTYSGASFVEHGRVDSFTDSLSLSGYREMTGNIREMVRKLNRDLNQFESQMLTCRGNELQNGKEACEAKDLAFNVIGQADIPKPLKTILKQIYAAIEPFTLNSQENLRYALQWCKRFGLVQQGYTLCQESIVTRLCDLFAELNPYKDDKKGYRMYRDYWSAILALDAKKVHDESAWKNPLACNRELSRSIFQLAWVRELRRKYSKLTNNRNQLNHAGFVGKVSADTIIGAFEVCIDDCLGFFDECLEHPETNSLNLPPLFINLSNHPSNTWTAEQLAAAESFGELVDVPFPQVAPDATAADIKALAEAQVAAIMQRAETHTVTVHVMGEMSLVYRIVRLLSERGIRCVCSTSYRVVKDEGDGRRLVEFHFNTFRDYD